MNLTVIITTYNAEKTIGRVLVALKENCPQDARVVVVDDGSTDSTREIIRDKEWPALSLICADKIGRARALNVGVAAAKEGIICINDADDLSLWERFNAAKILFENRTDFGLMFTGAYEVEHLEDCSEYCSGPQIASAQSIHDLKLKEVTVNRLYRGNPFHHSTAAFTKKTWLEVGKYREDLPVCIDYDFYLRVLEKRRVTFVDSKMLIRCIGNTRFYSKFSRINYLKVLLQIRKTYRAALKPNILLRFYDLRLALQLRLLKSTKS